MRYTITGILRNGKRFKPINTNTPWHYNIWRGSVWKNTDSGRKLVRRIYNQVDVIQIYKSNYETGRKDKMMTQKRRNVVRLTRLQRIDMIQRAFAQMKQILRTNNSVISDIQTSFGNKNIDHMTDAELTRYCHEMNSNYYRVCIKR